MRVRKLHPYQVGAWFLHPCKSTPQVGVRFVRPRKNRLETTQHARFFSDTLSL